jgi:hypothetical protein
MVVGLQTFLSLSHSGNLKIHLKPAIYLNTRHGSPIKLAGAVVAEVFAAQVKFQLLGNGVTDRRVQLVELLAGKRLSTSLNVELRTMASAHKVKGSCASAFCPHTLPMCAGR